MHSIGDARRIVSAPPTLNEREGRVVDTNGGEGLNRLQRALTAGDIAEVRRQLLALTGTELALLEEEIGAESIDRTLGAASRSRRSRRLGKVIVLPGIMGSLLDSVDRAGDADRVWIKALRLVLGRFQDLQLTVPEGQAASEGVRIDIAGLYRKTYLPLLVELDTRWDVRPFAFDWREDIRKSAERLDGELRAFGDGTPVHLVAHSMGGLVARHLIRHSEPTWAAVAGDDDGRSGGRLVMMGTPNRGSFSPVQAMTGTDKMVRRLALADQRHGLAEIASIIATFPGLYQMLPSASVDLEGDDHGRLFEATTWPTHVHQALLTRAAEFQRDLDEVIDPDRMIYVAGCNQMTTSRVTVEPDRSFRYDVSLDGDGTVPHALGLLDGVSTYYVEDTHGNLPKNPRVLDSIHELLATGGTKTLAASVPPRQSRSGTVAAGLAAERKRSEAVGDAELLALVSSERSVGTSLTPSERIRVVGLVTEQYLGDGGVAPPPMPDADVSTTPAVIDLEVVWGDVTKVSADYYSVGHYWGVMPQRAELALDRAISETDGEGILSASTRRGGIHADVGDLSFFPWRLGTGSDRLLAVAGMGRPGSFDAAALRRLVRGVAVAAIELPHIDRWCSVLIGSGEGTVDLDTAALAWTHGIADALRDTQKLEHRRIPELIIAEVSRERAYRVASAFKRAAADAADTITIKTSGRPRQGAGRRLVGTDVRRLLIKAIAVADPSDENDEVSVARATLIKSLSLTKALEADIESYLAGVASRSETSTTAHSAGVASRISFASDHDVVCVAAINETATVPERIITIDRELLDDLVERMSDPPADQVATLGRTLHRFLIPHEFRSVVSGSGPFVFEVDRFTGRFHWEMADGSVPSTAEEPLAIAAQVARQLRTRYSTFTPRSNDEHRPLRALVIGDPGDPALRNDLPGARAEALTVADLLQARGVEVDVRIGAPSIARRGRLTGIAPADRLDVLSLLSTKNYDVLHYSGHGDFDPVRPDRVGWLFASGLLTANEIQTLDHAPTLIVANACLSSRLSNVAGDGAVASDEPTRRALLVPSLADEFFKLGVRDYIGTAWEVNDVGAERFAAAFYTSLLGADGHSGQTIGESVRRARSALWRDRRVFNALWAAYQHYGDPFATLRGHANLQQVRIPSTASRGPTTVEAPNRLEG